jgi:hypothetical protein
VRSRNSVYLGRSAKTPRSMLCEVLVSMCISLWVFWFLCGTCHDFDGKLVAIALGQWIGSNGIWFHFVFFDTSLGSIDGRS